MDTWLNVNERPPEERSPAKTVVGTGDCGALTAEEYLQHAAEVNRIEREFGDPAFRNTHTRPTGTVQPVLDALASHFSTGTRYRCVYSDDGQCELRCEDVSGGGPLQPGETIYDRADQVDPASEADIVIDAVHNLPQRCRITQQHSGPYIALQERIRIQETGDYPTIERHLRRETPVYWAWEEGYDSPTLVPYQGRHFQT